MLYLCLTTKEEAKEYEEVCDFAKKVYADVLAADISSFPPIFLVLRDADRRIIACLGFTPASFKKPLVTERYFEPELLNSLFEGGFNKRESFAEMGTFAAAENYRRKEIYHLLLITFLNVAEYYRITYLLITVTRVVRGLLTRVLGASLRYIGRPDKNRLTESERVLWQNFFALKPLSYSMNVKTNLAVLSGKSKVIKGLEFEYSGQLEKIIKRAL